MQVMQEQLPAALASTQVAIIDCFRFAGQKQCFY